MLLRLCGELLALRPGKIATDPDCPRVVTEGNPWVLVIVGKGIGLIMVTVDLERENFQVLRGLGR